MTGRYIDNGHPLSQKSNRKAGTKPKVQQRRPDCTGLPDNPENIWYRLLLCLRETGRFQEIFSRDGIG